MSLAFRTFHTLRTIRTGGVALAALAAMTVGVLPPAIAQDEEKKADIPIQRVVMFSSGVAFFEHNGQVEGNAEVELKFNVKDINDLLKSMVLQDEGGGRISTVSYGSKDPITRTLATFWPTCSRKFAASRSRWMPRPKSPARSSALKNARSQRGKTARYSK